ICVQNVIWFLKQQLHVKFRVWWTAAQGGVVAAVGHCAICFTLPHQPVCVCVCVCVCPQLPNNPPAPSFLSPQSALVTGECTKRCEQSPSHLYITLSCKSSSEMYKR